MLSSTKDRNDLGAQPMMTQPEPVPFFLGGSTDDP
jgi:hypothetical protein